MKIDDLLNQLAKRGYERHPEGLFISNTRPVAVIRAEAEELGYQWTVVSSMQPSVNMPDVIHRIADENRIYQRYTFGILTTSEGKHFLHLFFTDYRDAIYAKMLT